MVFHGILVFAFDFDHTRYAALPSSNKFAPLYAI